MLNTIYLKDIQNRELEEKKIISLDVINGIIILFLQLEHVNATLIELLRPFVFFEEFENFENSNDVIKKTKIINEIEYLNKDKTINNFTATRKKLKKSISFDRIFINDIKELIKERKEIKETIDNSFELIQYDKDIDRGIDRGLIEVDFEKDPEEQQLLLIKEKFGKKIKKVKNFKKSKSCDDLKNDLFKISKRFLIENIKREEGYSRMRSNSVYFKKMERIILDLEQNYK